MKHLLLVPLWLSLAGCHLQGAVRQERALGDASKLSVLYAGHPESPRATRYVEFLRQWFARVDRIDLEDLDAQAAAGFDVVVADWKRRYAVEGGFDSDSGHRARIDADFTKPIVMIGAVGGELARGGKLDWL